MGNEFVDRLKSIHAGIILLLVVLLYPLASVANNEKDAYLFKKVDYQQGLSNSAVLCLFQDNEGLMWLGTYDGVNCWDGKSMEVFRSDFSVDKTLSNNVIHSISQADSSCLWISTHLGVNRFSQKKRQVVSNYDFQGDYYINSNAKGNTWVFASDGIYYYNTYHHNFALVQKPSYLIDRMGQRTFVMDDGTFWLFPPNSGQVKQYSLNTFEADSSSVRLSVSTTTFHSKAIEDIFYQNGIFCFIDCDQDLYMYDISRKSKIYIRNLSSLTQKYGVVTGVVPFYEDIIVAFRANGLIRLRTSKKYEAEVVNRNIRIYSLYRDPRQGMLWIASDGQGAVMYAKKYAIASNLMLNRISPELSRQVRSVMTDKKGGLWFGTKGDGLIHIPDFRTNPSNLAAAKVYSPEENQRAASYIKWDREFHVYKLVESRFMDGFWIGAGSPGLYYYSFSDDTVRPVENPTEQPAIEIHDIFEENDSTLYVVTAGTGFSKLVLGKQAGKVFVKRQHRYHFYHEQHEISLFYPMLAEGDSILWLGSRERGLIRFDKRTEEYKVISLKEKLRKSVDDVLSLYRAHDGKMYVGTTSGLVSLTFNGKKIEATYIGREQGLLNDMIHGVLEDGNGFLWLGTNRGLIKYNPKNGASHDYYYSAGAQIGEFSDDAYYQCPYTGNLFFGGIDGLLYLDRTVAAAPDFYPDILLRRLWIGRTEVRLGDYYVDNGKSLRLKGTETSFSLSFAVPDYLAGDEVEYSFMLEGYDEEWSSFSSMNEASYTDVPAGNYTFKIRYRKDVFDTEYKLFSIPICILPPWYKSTGAYVSYALLLLFLLGYLLHLLHKYVLRERNLKHLLDKEKARTQTFGNGIGDDMLDRFTLIYNSCDELRAENITYQQRLDKVSLIRETVMTALLNPNIVHREELKHFFPDKFIISARMSIQGVSQQVLNTLEEQGIKKDSIHSIIPESFIFPVYKNALYSILYYCYYQISRIHNAQVTVDATEDNGYMCLNFTSTDDAVKILHDSLVGEFSSALVKDADLEFADQLLLCFVQSALERVHAKVSCIEVTSGNQLTICFEASNLTEVSVQEKKTVLLLEDRDEMTWFISNFLADEYKVKPVKSIQLAFDEIRSSTPALLLVDMTMYAGAETTFMEYINKNRSLLSKTAFIPMLTWKVSSSIQRKLLLWADSYVVLPYDILFLREVVHNAIYGKREAKQIYMDELGNLAGQIVCSTNEQAEFVRKLLQVIEENLDNEELGSTLIAGKMAMSSRQFYRKFKEISNLSPSDLIRIYRMEKAALLLRNEELSIQDVISEVGIASRSYFYKEFTRRFGMTPKDYRDQSILRTNSID